MNLTLDEDRFDAFQKAFTLAITEAIMVKLVEAGITGQKMEQATADIAFSITSLLDDTTAIDAEGDDVKPYLTFRTDDDELLHCGENAYTYEFVRGSLKTLFDV